MQEVYVITRDNIDTTPYEGSVDTYILEVHANKEIAEKRLIQLSEEYNEAVDYDARKYYLIVQEDKDHIVVYTSFPTMDDDNVRHISTKEELEYIKDNAWFEVEFTIHTRTLIA